MEKTRWEGLVRKWLDEAHGPVLALDIEKVPEDLRRRAVWVTDDNVMDVVRLVAMSAAVVFYDPRNRLDSAVRDKMLVVRGFGSEEEEGTRGS
jgi:hypothetical protein